MRDRLTDTAKDLESPFLDEEILTAEPHDAAEPRVARLAEHSPFEGLLFFPGGRATPGSGGGGTPVLSRPDFWPDVVYIAKGGDNFLSTARAFYKMWGFAPVEFESLEGLIGLIAKAKNLGQRIRVVSHAWDGFNIPLFNGSPVGFTITQSQIEAVNAGDGALMDALLGKLVDLDATTNQGQTAWTALLVHLESSAPDALKPFGLSSGTKPTGDLELLLRRCADLIAVASADPALKNAVRKSIAAAAARLKRTNPEANALETAVTSSGFTFTMSAATSDMVKRLRAAVDALDRRAFRKTLKDARTKLAGTWLDFRGCRIGHQPTYLEALARLMGTDGCTAPDWWSGYPGEVPLRDQQVGSADAFKSIVKASKAAEAAMNRWGTLAIAGWSGVAAADRPVRFFNDVLAKGEVFPVYEVDHSGATLKQKHMLFWNSAKSKERWLEAMWDRAPKKRVQAIAGAWKGKTPRMATLAKHLKAASGSGANPQMIFVAPEPEFRDHIIEVKKP